MVEISPDCFAIYPNPTAEILKLEMEESSLGQPAIICIHSKTGQLMARREVKAVDGAIEFNVSHYPAGTYIANVQVGERKPEVRCFVVVD
ncbi:MAG: T9SS type A sorting domain-containing protein [Lewinellaceae bacterium]|nr:T9SS type A sorting domain-containing protein [Phaeodactylibacter sp.]MCB9035622.1 T9SS type A sorting domain-containing protein [Lewinellaceae bacterium]